jgi:hypothetical protein
MAIDVEKDCATECFQDVEDLIYKTTHKFRAKFGGEFEELKSRAFFHFMRAHDSYVENTSEWVRTKSTHKKICFTTWVQNVVYRGLIDDFRKDQKVKRIRPEDLQERHTDSSGLCELMADVHEDSKTIINLILETPMELTSLITHEGGSIKHVKTALTKYLQNMGWEMERIATSYNRIETVLCS